MARITKSHIVPIVVFVIIISIILTISNFQDQKLNEKLNECSKVTCATITRTYRKGGMPHVVYVYKVSGKTYENDESVDAYAIGEPFWVNLGNVKNNPLLIRFYCNNPDEHKIIWKKLLSQSSQK